MSFCVGFDAPNSGSKPSRPISSRNQCAFAPEENRAYPLNIEPGAGIWSTLMESFPPAAPPRGAADTASAGAAGAGNVTFGNSFSGNSVPGISDNSNRKSM